MIIEYFHASKYGNGATVAAQFAADMAAKGVTVNVHHIKDARPDDIPAADLYAFSSPTHMGRPRGGMRRFLKKAVLPSGARYALVATAMAPQPDKKSGVIPSLGEIERWRRTIPVMDELLTAKGLTKVADATVQVAASEGPLEEGWQAKVAALADQIDA